MNEEFKTCGTACEPTCEAQPAFCTLQCVIGCQCKNGFVRNSNNECVKKEDCNKADPTVAPVQSCPANETFSDCHNACSEPKCPTGVEVGCSCNQGFRRNSEGRCVLESECPPVTNENPCNLTDCPPGTACQVQNQKAICRNASHSLSCASMLCQVGHSCQQIDGRATCVSIETPIDPVPSVRPRLTCANIRCGSKAGCAMVMPSNCQGTSCEGHPMCIDENPCHYTKCAAGQTCRLQEIQCIRAPCQRENCDLTPSAPACSCGHNETFSSCYNACSEPKCGDDSLKMCNRMCTQGCACNEGFYRNFDGICVLQEDCEKPTETDSICASNEIFSKCFNSCLEKKCQENRDEICLEMCSEGCTCIDGFYRNSKGICVSREECDTFLETHSNITCGKNEVLSTCHNPCSEPNCVSNPSQMCTLMCFQGCSCIEGFYRNLDGECVQHSECPQDDAIRTCGTNETFSNCYNTCEEPKCQKSNENAMCEMCAQGCTCNDGFHRSPEGTCVAHEDCPPVMKCPKDNVFTECYNSCSEAKCKSADKNERGIICKGTEEHSNCAPQCEYYCTGRLACSQTNNTCTPGCICRPKYKKDSNGICVHNRHCFKTTTCIENEEWSKLATFSCANVRCSGGTRCVMVETCPGVSKPICLKENAWGTIDCPNEQTCKQQEVKCLRAPW
ncbi:unnamed protein product [Caenorhabditis bovis]|uniref:Follistatin-like domain-containing protein n=1 Tax=Caenorhabditis bovis TaxID=2654633 RepID=A0A8S1EGP3_9PELO|nr:unnamed protein product [Caenorhabditis bovis]